MPRGRPRSFDADAALDAALALFWRCGYEGTSLASLTEAMGINGPSLYAAFGNKESLFRKAVHRYDEKYGTLFRRALAEPTAPGVAEALMRGAIVQATRPRHPRGCLLVQGALAAGPDNDSARDVLRRCRADAEKAIRARFERALAEGDLPPDADPAVLARYVWTVNLGIAVQAAGGASRRELESVARQAMQAFRARCVEPGVDSKSAR